MTVNVVKKEVVKEGEPLPCPQSRILNTERRQSGLEVWYTEDTAI